MTSFWKKEAAKRKLTVPALLDAEITSKVDLVTEQEIEKFYQDNKTQFKGEQAQVRVNLKPPPYRVSRANATTAS